MKKVFIVMFCTLCFCLFGYINAESYSLPTITYPNKLVYNAKKAALNDKYSSEFAYASYQTSKINNVINMMKDNKLAESEVFEEGTHKEFTLYYFDDMLKTYNFKFMVDGNIVKLGEDIFEVNYSGEKTNFEQEVEALFEDGELQYKGSNVPYSKENGYEIVDSGFYNLVANKDSKKVNFRMTVFKATDLMDILSLLENKKEVKKAEAQKNNLVTVLGFYRQKNDEYEYVMINFYSNNYINVIISGAKENEKITVKQNKFYKVTVPSKLKSSVNDVSAYVKKLSETYKSNKLLDYYLETSFSKFEYDFKEDTKMKELFENNKALMPTFAMMSFIDGYAFDRESEIELPEMNLSEINEYVKDLKYFKTDKFMIGDNPVSLSYYFGENKFYYLMNYDGEISFHGYNSDLYGIFKDMLTIEKVTSEQEEISNPPTSDSICNYFIVELISVLSIIGVALKLRKSE